LFRIDRNYVHLAASQFVQIGCVEAVEDLEREDLEREEVESRKPIDDAVVLSKAEIAAQKIINNAEMKAGQMIMDARNEIAALLLSAKEQAEEDRRRAWQEGFAEGAEEGRRSFDEQLEEKTRLDDLSLRSVLDEINSELTRTYSELEKEVVSLALKIVRKMISPAEEQLGSLYEPLIKNALKKLNIDKKIIIRVSPVEYERFFPSGNAVFELDSGAKVTASVLRDVSLGDGDCIIDYEDGAVNAGFDSQLNYIRLAFDSI